MVEGLCTANRRGPAIRLNGRVTNRGRTSGGVGPIVRNLSIDNLQRIAKGLRVNAICCFSRRIEM